jgi:sulfopyruvate decarboxylase TPP-binding subunit
MVGKPVMTIAPELTVAQRPEPAIGPPGIVVDVFDRLGVEFALGVADSQLGDVLAAISQRMPLLFTAREDAAVAMAVGMELAGRRAAVFMKNAGLGTSLDSLISLATAAEVPVLLVVGWAGSGRDTLPHHAVMGDRTIALLEAAGIEYGIVRRHGSREDAAAFSDQAMLAARRHRRPYALVVEP